MAAKYEGNFDFSKSLRLKQYLIFVLMVFSAVLTYSQTDIEAETGLPEHSHIVRQGSLPEDSAEQAEAGEDTPPEDSAEPTEVGEDTPPVYSAEQTEASEGSPPDFFISPLVELVGFSRKGPALGGGFAVGAGNGVAIGGRVFLAIDTESVFTMELTVFMRFYLEGADACTGPFVQLIAGAALFAHKGFISLPAKAGAFSAGIAAGWRFPLWERWYIEPTIRVGHPYIIGAGASFAFRF